MRGNIPLISKRALSGAAPRRRTRCGLAARLFRADEAPLQRLTAADIRSLHHDWDPSQSRMWSRFRYRRPRLALPWKRQRFGQEVSRLRVRRRADRETFLTAPARLGRPFRNKTDLAQGAVLDEADGVLLLDFGAVA